MVKRWIRRSVLVLAINFLGMASPANRLPRGEIDVVATRCTLCKVDAAASQDYRVVWCNGKKSVPKIYLFLTDAAAREVGGHCVHLKCLKLYLLQGNKQCPIPACCRDYSPSERGALLSALGEDGFGYDGLDECESLES